MKMPYHFSQHRIFQIFKLCLSLMLFTFLSCTSMDDMPRVVSIFRGEIENVKLTNYVQEKNNNVTLTFDKNIKEITCIASFDEDYEDNIPCIVQKINDNDKDFVVQLQEDVQIDIGKEYYVKGEVKDKWGNSLLFFLPFTGANTHPASLRISEVRPLYSKKPKGEFIEMIVEKSGNLSGIKIMNVGSKKQPHYTFPPAEVKKGEIVVYHWRCFDEEVKDEVEASIISHGSGASAYARDFWSVHKSLPKRKSNAIVIEESGNVQDAILFFDPKTENDDWPTEEIANAATIAFESGVWSPSPQIKDAVRVHVTPSTSLGRSIIPKSNVSNAKQWVLYKSKQVTQGKRNR